MSFYEAAGAEVRDRMHWNNGERADVFLGPVMITLFTQAIYEESVDLPADCFLHPALFTDDLDSDLEGHDVIWGPAVVEGAFGKRRIAFVNAPGRYPAGVHGAARARARATPRTVGTTRRALVKVTRFHHVSVNTNGASLEDLAAFYRDVLGLGDKPRPDIPGRARPLARRRRSGAPSRRRSAPRDPDRLHRAITTALPSTDLDAAVAELEDRGIEYQRAVQGRGHRADLDQ